MFFGSEFIRYLGGWQQYTNNSYNELVGKHIVHFQATIIILETVTI